MSNAIPKFLIAVFLPLAIYTIYLAVHWGLADIYYRPAKNELRDWSKGDVVLENKDWERLRINLSKALKLDPNNPDIHENLALAIEGRFASTPSKDAEAEVFRKQALEHYRKSTLLRPVWPYAWSNLALVKYRLGQIDEEFFKAMHNADRLGRWEPSIQIMLLNMGFINWLQFPQSEKEFVLETVSRALEKQPETTLELVNRYGNLDIICLLHKDKQNVVELCKNIKLKNK